MQASDKIMENAIQYSVNREIELMQVYMVHMFKIRAAKPPYASECVVKEAA